MLRQLNDAFDKEIVLPEATAEDLTTSARYSKVQGIFKAGCRACTTTEFCHYLCETCKEASKDTNVEDLEKMIQELENVQYPAFHTEGDESRLNNSNNNINNNDDGNIEMRNQNDLYKRKRDDASSTEEESDV